MQQSEARPATSSDVVGLSEVLTRGFSDDPIWRWMAPEDRRWPRRLAPVFRHLIAPPVGYGTTWTTDAHEGAAVWAPPGKSSFPDSAAVRSAPAMLRGFGFSGLRRTLRMVGRMEKVHPKEPHWYLGIVGADPGRQGTGAGGAVIDSVLETCDAEGVPAFLESSKERNISYYERFGFEVTGEERLPKGGPPFWTMWREPRPR